MRFLGLASRNLKETYRDVLTLALLLAMPLVFMALFGLIMGKQPFWGGLAFMDFVGPGWIIFGLLFLIPTSGGRMAKDKENGFLSRLMTTPASALDFIMGYSLCLVAVIIIQIIIFIAAAWWFGMNVVGSLCLLFLVFFLTGLVCIGIAVIVASLCKSAAQAEALSIMFVMPLTFLTGQWIPVESMPSYLRGIAYAFPFARALDAARGVIIKGLGLEALSSDLLFLAGFAVVFFTIGVILFRNCLVVSRIRSMFSYILALAILAGLLCFGFFGGDLRFTGHISSVNLPGATSTPQATVVSFPENFEVVPENWTGG